MSPAPAGLRLFVAIYPPPETIRELASCLGRLGLEEKGRVPDDHVHLTVRFIGDTAARDFAEVRETVEHAASGVRAFDLLPLRLFTLPPGPRPRLVAAETDAPPPLMELHRRLAHRLAKNTRERSRERFTPHLTLQRFKSPARPVDLPLALAPFHVGYVSLMRSVPRTSGAQHAEVARVALE